MATHDQPAEQPSTTQGFRRPNRLARAVAVAGVVLVVGVAGAFAAGALRSRDSRKPSAAARELAEAAEAACRRQEHESEMPCYLGVLLPEAERHLDVSLAALEELANRDKHVRNNGHAYAHAIGMRAYAGAGGVGPAFGGCTETFNSGCFHGVIQAHFEAVAAELPSDPNGLRLPESAVEDLCTSFRGPGGDPLQLFHCAHGLGHGLTTLHGHDLPRALHDCDLVDDFVERESCYGGAFMENIVHTIQPHHSGKGLAAHAVPRAGAPLPVVPAARPGSAGGRPASAHDPVAGHAPLAGETDAAPEARGQFLALRADDPHYPCNALPRKYRAACYTMQTSAVLHFNGRDFGATARFCDEAPPPTRSWCYASLGRDASAEARGDQGEAIRLCGLGSPAYRPWCFAGAVKDIAYTRGEAERGVTFCRGVPDGRERAICYAALGEQLHQLALPPDRRDRICEAVEPAHRGDCRAGARLEPGAVARSQL